MSEQTPQQIEANARRQFDELQRAIHGFQVARTKTDNAALGVVPNGRGLSPAQVAQRVRELRDMPIMERAVGELYDLLTVLYQRDPTEDELKAGPPGGEALGNFVIPAVPASVQVLAALAMGAWTLTSLFEYLQAREERIQNELGIQDSAAGSRLPGLLGALAVAGVIGTGGYLWWRHRRHAAEEIDEEEEDGAEESAEEELPATSSYHIHIEQQPAEPPRPSTLAPVEIQALPAPKEFEEDVIEADYEEVHE